MNRNAEQSDQDKLVRRILLGALIISILLLIALLVALGFGFRWYISPENKLSIVQRRDLVQGMASAAQALAVFLTGAVGLIGLFFTWRNTNDVRESTRKTLEITEQGQITERFTKAIEQLGEEDEHDKPRLEVRLGGIYALERIARDSIRDYGQILEILTAYIRENAPWPPKEASPGTLTDSEVNEWRKWLRGNIDTVLLPSAASDIQAILNVLKRREEDRVPTEYRITLYLHGTDLGGADLMGINLAGAVLKGANLQGAWLIGANLEGADLSEARLQRAWLSGSRLARTNFTDARLEGAALGGATTTNPTLQENRLFGLEDTNVADIDVEAVDLRETQGLAPEQLEGALGDVGVMLPQGLQQPDSWNLDYSEQIETIRERM